MSTNCNIGIERADGRITAIYCKWDGTLDHTGAILLSLFMDSSRVAVLTRSGPLGMLCEYVRRTIDRGYRCPLSCSPWPAAGRRRTRWLSFQSREHLVTDGEEYVYLFGLDGKWRWARYHHGPLQLLIVEQCVRTSMVGEEVKIDG